MSNWLIAILRQISLEILFAKYHAYIFQKIVIFAQLFN